MTGRAYVHGRSAEPSLAEIHQEMSELLDKQVNALKEKIFWGSRKLPQAHEKVCDENERRKNDTRVKMIFMEGRPL